jgi:hypothetical protein
LDFIVDLKHHYVATRSFSGSTARVSTYLVLFSFILFSGCFKPEGENFVPVESPVLENVEINLAEADEDIYIYNPTTLSYKINQGTFQLIKIEGFLDGQSLYDPSRPSVLYIDPTKFATGAHTLKLEATFLSRSETLASKLGKDIQSVSKEFTITIEIDEPDPIKITKIEPANGTLYVTWNAPAKLNFFNYRVHRYTKQGGETWIETYSQTPWILAPSSTQFSDSLYTGDEVQYRVDVVGYNFLTEGIPADTTFKLIDPVVTQTATNTITVSWGPPLFYANISEIRYQRSYDGPVQPFSATKAGSFTDEIPFGSLTYFSYGGVPKYENGGLGSLLRTYIGNELTFEGLEEPDYYALHYYGDQEILVNESFSPRDILLVNSSQKQIKKRIDLTPYYASAQYSWSAEHALFGTTPDGNSLFLFTGMEVIRLNKDLEYAETIDLTDINPGVSITIYGIQMSNNNIACFYMSGGVGVVDLENNITIAKALLPTSYIPVRISPDGRYVEYDGSLYDVRSKSMDLLSTLDNYMEIRDLRFNKASDRLFIVYRSGHFVSYDLKTLTVTSEFTLPGEPYNEMSYDPVSGLCGVKVLATEQQFDFTVFDPLTGTIKKKIRTDQDCYLYNNTIYSNRFALPL